MSVRQDATGQSRHILRIAVVAAAMGVVAMFSAAATFAGTAAQASEAAPQVAATQR